MADHVGNRTIVTWEGDGQQRRFELGGMPSAAVRQVMEGAETYPAMTFGVDRGFRWSYDAETKALIVADDQPAPAEGVIISCSYEPAPYTGDGEWTHLTFKQIEPSDTERQLIATRVEAAFGLRPKP